MTENESGIGRKVAYYRARKGLSQRDFAPLIKRSEAWVSQVERGVRPVKALDVLERIAEVLDIPVSELAPTARTVRAEPIPADAAALRRLLTANHALAAMVAEGAPEPDYALLAERVESVWSFTRHARYADLLPVLEPLLPELEAAAVRPTSGRADELLASTYQAWAVALSELQQFDAAWVAAERAMSKAQRTGDPVLLASAAFRLTLIFQRSQQLDQAGYAAETARAALEPLVDQGDPRALSVYGALTLQAAVVAARAEDAESAHDLLVRARKVATDLGRDRDDYQTGFGPTAVDLHEVSVAVELGDAGTAIRLAGKVDTRPLSTANHCRLLVDTARAWAQRRSPERALGLLLEAEDLAPEQIGRHRTVRATTSDLLYMDQATPGLTEFAQRVGIDPELFQPPANRAGLPRSGLRAARGPRTI